ncbi:hypothetical protein I0P70_17915 [Pontibacter sp. FD36]|uniref:hypothetical protein n=1 Tax=Pontibacter sp. FD36 TaxID=2789860 RepID=UPI0018AC82FA|nr:hypothetical protein [Pontibacter sp. FD36]MBF8965130.1 hypothetical protein [Pontibacter sp. FD36]
MRDYRDQNYGDFSRQYQEEHPRQQQYRREQRDWDQRPEDEGSGRQYRARHEERDRFEGNYRGNMADYYNTMYDTSNYTGVPRHDEYGLPYGSENDLDRISRGNPRFADPDRFERTRYRYNSGYNPNYDNPEEGDLYRDFDSRGNHGFRHDASYGNADEFRDFGDDHYGSPDRSGRY